jgi:hypothetical protein
VDEQKLENYARTKEHVENLTSAEIRLDEYCQRLRNDLDNATYQEKREILGMLAIKVVATPEHINVEGVIPLEATPTQSADEPSYLLTIGQTSVSLFNCRYTYIEGKGYALSRT